MPAGGRAVPPAWACPLSGNLAACLAFPLSPARRGDRRLGRARPAGRVVGHSLYRARRSKSPEIRKGDNLLIGRAVFRGPSIGQDGGGEGADPVRVALGSSRRHDHGWAARSTRVGTRDTVPVSSDGNQPNLSCVVVDTRPHIRRTTRNCDLLSRRLFVFGQCTPCLFAATTQHALRATRISKPAQLVENLSFIIPAVLPPSVQSWPDASRPSHHLHTGGGDPRSRKP